MFKGAAPRPESISFIDNTHSAVHHPTMAYELVGHLASILVVVSLLMSNLLSLRILNLIGAITFTAYGSLIGSLPIVLSNTAIIFINLYHLTRAVRESRTKIRYRRVEGTVQVEEFVRDRKPDILKHFPLFRESLFGNLESPEASLYLALNGAVTQGFALFIPVPEADEARDREERELLEFVHTTLFPRESLYLPIDYILPKYRGLGIAQHLYESLQADVSSEMRYSIAVGRRKDRANHRFLARNGYETVKDFATYRLYAKTLQPKEKT